MTETKKSNVTADRQEAYAMAEKRKDNRGRNLRIGEYFDSKNKRYMFHKMIEGGNRAKTG